MRILALSCALTCITFSSAAYAQFKQEADPNGAKLQPGSTQRLRCGVSVTAVGGPCKSITATVPVPLEWPEQQLKIVDQEISPTVKNLHYRTIGGLKQMLVEIPQLPAGQEAKAMITFEAYRSIVLSPPNTAEYSIPKKIDRDMVIYTGTSPYIETRHAKIMSLAREIPSGKEDAWREVEAIYDWVREHIEHQSGNLKGAARALADKQGDTDELVSLFIALCRAHKIPARTVFVPGHCYAEFYLVDQEGQGHWFPCQLVGNRSFGGINEQRPILQKGDNFHDPERPREVMRFVSEHLTGGVVRGGGQPRVKFVREVVGGGP